nr:TPA: orf y [Tanacetum cinerariifolium]
MSLANPKATTEYQEAIQATEDIEPPAVGFEKTTYYKGGLTNQVNAVIKQNNTLLYLASKQSQKLIELEEKFDKLKQKVNTIIEKEIQPADLEDSISSLAKRLNNFSISGRLSNTSYMGFQYSMENVVDHLITNGITAILGESRSIEELEGMSWNLKPPEQTSVHVSSRVAVNERLNRSDDDERSGGKTLVIQEKLAQNQQDFLDEYLPQWDDQLATRKQRSKLEWENPFAAKREDFRQLAIKSGKLYFPSTTKKLFTKLPPSLSKKIEESFKARHPGLSAGVLPTIKFTHTFVSEMCKDAVLAKELRDLSLCSAIPILCYYKNNRKKYGIRKSRTYKGKPYNSHVKPFKRKYKDDRGRVKKYFDDSSVYNISKGEGDVYQNISIMVQDTPIKEAAFMAIEESNETWKKPDKELPTQSKSYEHDWKENAVTNYTICYYYGILTTDMSRLNCPKFQLTSCALCAKNYLGKTVNVKRKQQHKPEKEKDFSSNEVRLLKELLKEKTEQEEFPPLGNSQIARPFMEAEAHYSESTTTAPKIRKITNQLYNVKVEFEIPSCPMFGTTAIIDTGSSACCINKKVIPEEALEPLTQTVFFNGLNARQQATHKIKQCNFLIEGNKFKIPLIYAFDMRDSNGIEMLIGANFLRSMKGGIQIEGNEITIYKKVTRIKTSNQTEIAEIVELKVSEEEFLEINESIYFNQEGSKAFLEQFKPVIDRLKHQGYIEEEPLKHWKKNGELCKLDIINPDITIEDRSLKHVIPSMEDSFKKHVDNLLKIGAIRPSKSQHRTMAMIVNSGTTIVPVTGKEVKGKQRIVFNYKSLNDNTYKDQYSLPGINTIIKIIGGAKIFSKFDLKSGFHQVSMDEESIP